MMVIFAHAMRRVLAIALFVVGCNGTPIQHGLDESSANEVITALESAGIAAVKLAGEANAEPPTFTVSVRSPDDIARAMELMHSRGLPRGRRSGLAEMYGQPSLVPSPTEERARYLEALGNDVERTLETIDGVISAHVHLVLAENDPLAADPRPRVPAQASVLLKIRAGVAPPIKEIDVQRLVAGSVSGLQPSSVAVISIPAPEWTGASAPTLIAFGPVRLAPGSRAILGGFFAAVLGVIAILALVLLFTARRLAAVQRERRA